MLGRMYVGGCDDRPSKTGRTLFLRNCAAVRCRRHGVRTGPVIRDGKAALRLRHLNCHCLASKLKKGVSSTRFCVEEVKREMKGNRTQRRPCSVGPCSYVSRFQRSSS